MKQIEITKYGSAKEAFQLKEKGDLVPKDGEVLIKAEGFGLNYADVMARTGLYKDAPPLPFVPGYEIVGKVIQRGKDVPAKFEGKRVVAFTRFGGYADHAVADFRGTAIIDESIPGGEACALATQYCTAYYMTDYVSSMHRGETALVHACAGGVGTALTQLCHLKGVVVIGLCSSREKVDYLKKMEVEFPINYEETNYTEYVESHLGKHRVDHVFNPVAGKSFKNDLKLLSFGGKIYCFGGSSRNGKGKSMLKDLIFLLRTGFVSPLFMMMKSQSVIAVNMLRIAENNIHIIGQCLHDLVQLWAKGEISPIVGGLFPVEDIAAAHELLESGKSKGKIYVQW